jgi:DNA repair protein SbcC/Rad50
MHITKVELEDIKSHAQSSFEFHRGTTAITGANGAGKTTILEAIAWTLFDLLDYKKDDFLRRGAKRGTARVTFESHLDGRRYTVYRDTGTGYYVYDNELKTRIAEKKHEVGRFLAQHLGVEPGTDLETLFRSAIGVPQGTLTAIFLETAAARKNTFDRLLKVEEYREGAEKLRETVRFVERRLQDVREKIKFAEGELSRLEQTETAHRETIAKIVELEKELASLRALIAEKSTTVAELEKAENAVTETRARRDKSEVKLDAQRRNERRVSAERDAAADAAEKQKSVEADYRAHLGALDELKILDARQLERNQIQLEAQRVENRLVEARAELRRCEENLQKALDAAKQIVELQSKIAEQETLERERENLRTRRAEANQAAQQVENLETQIKERQKTWRETAAQIRDAETGRDAESRIQALEAERKTVEAELKSAEQAETSLKILLPQRKQLRADIERLQETLEKSERENAGFDEILGRAAQVTALDRQENSLVAEIAKLRAKIEHDEKFRGEVRNGLCPILSAKCLNIREGETLETFFQHELSTSYDRLGALESEQKTVSGDLKSAREAERRLAKLETVRAQIETARADFRAREESLQKIETEIRSFNGFKPESVNILRVRKSELETQISVLNLAARRFAEIKALEQCLADIKDEGSRLRDEQNRQKEIAARSPEIEKRLDEIEKRLRELASPRERAATLRREAEAEAAWRAKIETERAGLEEHEKSLQIFVEKLTAFAALDADLSRVRATRDHTLVAYQTFLANRALAESLPTRETEFARAVEETAGLEKDFAAVQEDFRRATENYNRERHLIEKSALLDAERREAATANEFAQARRREVDLKTEIERLAEVRRQMQAEFQEKYKLERVAETTDFIRDTLKKAAPEVAKSYLFSISREANEIFREITGSAERSLRWTEDYEIMLEEAGHERPFVNLSGGEQMAAALSMRLALLKQLSDVRVAFFDEPTTNLDRERRERLAQQIGQIRNFDQLFVISHDDTFEENVDYHLHVGGRQNNSRGDDAE